jgi:ubiquitin carboxyl-terminal hydrolase 10
MKSLPEEIMHSESVHLLNSPLKILAAVNAFVSEFSALENFPRMNHRKEKNKKQEDLPLGKTFEAATIFQVLLNLNSDTFKVIEGRQEDAEEFLTFLLNGLNDEMLSVLKLLSNDSAEETEEDLKNVSGPASKIDSEEDDEWQEVGPKNKSCVTRRGGDLGTSCGLKTPLGDMFQGQIRSCVNRTAGETTATLQPFFTLQVLKQTIKIKNSWTSRCNNVRLSQLYLRKEGN